MGHASQDRAQLGSGDRIDRRIGHVDGSGAQITRAKFYAADSQTLERVSGFGSQQDKLAQPHCDNEDKIPPIYGLMLAAGFSLGFWILLYIALTEG